MGTDDELPTNESKSASNPVSQSAVEQASCSSLSRSTDSSGLPKDQSKPIMPTATLTSENVNAHSVNGACQECPCAARYDEGDNSSDVSEISDLSHESWQPVQGPISWVHEQMRKGQSPRSILEKLVPKGTVIPEGLDVVTLWKIIISIVSEPPKRKKLEGINTLDDVIHLLKTCKKIIVLTGAGVSVSCGIPDFRSKDGVYARLAKDFPNLPDPQAMFDIHFFRSDPRPFYKFAKEIYPGQFNPSLCHHFIRLLETKGKLLRNYTQNIDTLEQEAGIERVVQCHGSFATASCAVCGYKVNSNIIKEDIFNQVIPRCPNCPAGNEQAVMKPDIVFFGESLPEHFHNLMTADKEECDLLIVIGSSLKVRPVALIPNSLPAGIPQILINRERLHYLNFDVELLGNCDNIVAELCRRLGESWDHIVSQEPLLEQVLISNLPTPSASPEQQSSNREENSESTGCSREGDNIQVSSSSSEDHPDFAKSNNSMKASEIESTDGIHAGPSTVKLSSKEHNHHHHHHRKTHKLMPPLMSDEPNTVEESVSSSSVSSAKQQEHEEDMDRLVTAGHRQDVVYEPGKLESSTSHHHQHQQHHHHHHQNESTGSSASHTNHSKAGAHHHHSHSYISSQSSQPLTHRTLPPGSALDQPQPSRSIPSQQEAETSESLLCSLPDSALQPSTPSFPEKRRLSVDQPLLREHTLDGEPELKKQKLLNDAANLSCLETHPSECVNIISSESHSKDETAGKLADAATNFEAFEDVSKNESNCVDGLEEKEDETGDDLEDLQRVWSSIPRVSIAERLATNQMLFIPPSRYIFKGAEVYSDESESEDDEDSQGDDEQNINENEEESSSREAEVSQKPTMSTSSSMPSAEESSATEETSTETQQAGSIVQDSRETLPIREIHRDIVAGMAHREGSSSAAAASSSVCEKNTTGDVNVMGNSYEKQEKADCVVTSTEDVS